MGPHPDYDHQTARNMGIINPLPWKTYSGGNGPSPEAIARAKARSLAYQREYGKFQASAYSRRLRGVA